MQDTIQLLPTTNFSPFNFPLRELNHNAWVDTLIVHGEGFSINPVSYEGTVAPSSSSVWIIVVLLIGFLSVAISRSVYRKRFDMLYKTLANWKLSKQIIRYEKVYTHPVNILLILNFILTVPLFFSLVYVKLFNPSTLLESQYFMVMIPLIVYLLAKTGLYQFSGWLWNEKPVIEEYLFQSNLFNKYSGVAFLFLTSLVVYSPIELSTLAKIGLITIALLAFFQLIRGFIIGLENGKQLIFIIAYLCTLEILPWFVIAKWIKISL
ncbi:DUF4271 domain-containing protein [Vicingaceae bacterium]|nr:DUF4271 domain-containing protein [Vicingaceae bacterium]